MCLLLPNFGIFYCSASVLSALQERTIITVKSVAGFILIHLPHHSLFLPHGPPDRDLTLVLVSDGDYLITLPRKKKSIL